MSLHQCPASSVNPSLRSQPLQPSLGSGIKPGAIAPTVSQGITRWCRCALALTPLLLAPLTTGCTVEWVEAPTQNRANPAQAAEQAPTDPQGSTSIKTRATAEIPAEPPKPSQEIPELMSQASSTANSDLFPAPEFSSHQGPLRIGNQTEHPLRIAFLAKGEAPAASEASGENPSIAIDSPEAASSVVNGPEQQPFHWDFAPAEGGSNGLLLSLPQGDLTLQDGDVVVAFAQDGSQRYWGPYVVGQTSLPHWNSDRSEWQLLVQP